MSNKYTNIIKIQLPATRLTPPRGSPVLSGAGVEGVNGKFHRVLGKLVNDAPYFRNAAGFEISLAKGQQFWAILGRNGGAFYFAPANPADIFTPPSEWTPHTLANGAAAPVLHLELEQEAGHTNSLTPREPEEKEKLPSLERVPLPRQLSETSAASPSPAAICKMNFMASDSPYPNHRRDTSWSSQKEGTPPWAASPAARTPHSRRTSAYSNNDSPPTMAQVSQRISLVVPQTAQRIPRQDLAQTQAQQTLPALPPRPVPAAASQVGQVFSKVGDYKPPGVGHMATRVSPQVLPSSFSPSLLAQVPTQPYGLPAQPLPNVTYSPPLARHPNHSYFQRDFQWHQAPYLPPSQHTQTGHIQQGGSANNVYYMVQPVMAPTSLFNQAPRQTQAPSMTLPSGIANPMTHSIFSQMNGGFFTPPPQAHPAAETRRLPAPSQQPPQAGQPAQLPTTATRTSPELVEDGRPQSHHSIRALLVSDLGGEPIQEAETRPRTASSAVIAPPVQDPAEVLPRYYRVVVATGITYRMTQNLQDKFAGQVAKHGCVVEAEVQDQDFIRCSNGLWLPKRIGKQDLLVPADDEMDFYQVLVQPGISFRRSMDMKDKSKREFAKYGDRIAVHRMEGDWVAIAGGLYLPLRLKEGECVTQLLEKLEQESVNTLEFSNEVSSVGSNSMGKEQTRAELERRTSHLSIYSG